ncbi:glycosyltransferase family 2 protein [Aeromonas hydrophila]|uniref:glycosyltransferase family 2 protein n=1 Tax=Aeromonas hydrophila TaxID=644 RepID=UPI00256F5592|nr:glycosyltransferase [Aeromonas hydrophila]MDL5385546.1 glycosyltransferase [Aeromonas hydrophila]
MKKTYDISSSKPDILVSVLCLSFNHELYLRCALDSMVMQETSFKYEILVHDDASSDNSQSIISEYERMYPDIIISLKRIDNVYSKNDRLSIWRYFAEYAKGDFIAFCEGDDYWSSSHKLEYQVSELMKNSKCNMSFHPTTRLSAETGSCLGLYGHIDGLDSLRSSYIPFLSASDLFFTNIIHISSVMIRRCAFLSFYDFLASHSWIDTSDYFIKLISMSAGVIYLSEDMSVYRESVSGSWSSIRKNNLQLKVSHCLKMLSVSQDISSLYSSQYCLVGHRHLLKYTLDLHTLLHSANALHYLSGFYFGLREKLDKALIPYSSHDLIYFGAGSIFNSIVFGRKHDFTVIDGGDIIKRGENNISYSCKLNKHSFKKNTVIVITPLFRGHSIRNYLVEELALDCHFIIVDDFIDFDFVSQSIFSSAQQFLVDEGFSTEGNYLTLV